MQLTIGKKIIFCFSLSIILVSILAFVANKSFKDMGQAAKELQGINKEAYVISSLSENIMFYRYFIMEAISDENAQKYIEEFKTNQNSIKEKMELLNALDKKEEEKKLIKDISEQIKSMDQIINDNIIPILKKEKNLTQEERQKIFNNADAEIDSKGGVMTLSLSKIKESLDSNRQMKEKNFEESLSSESFILFISLASIIFGIFIMIYLNLNIRNIIKTLFEESNMVLKAAQEGKLKHRANPQNVNFEFRHILDGLNKILDTLLAPINEAGQILTKMAQGDFSSKMKGNYQGDNALLKNSLNQSLDSISKTLSETLDSIKLVNTSSSQVSDTSASLSQGASEQASALEEITSSVNEIGSQTKTNADNANQAKTIGMEAQKSAQTGNSHMKEMITSMNQITQSSENIAKIIKVIDEIAFQTNLLALNAAVEAARAGKHGKGFAVVAEEVRNLAARSAKAAKETTDIIEDSKNKVKQGSDTANKTAKSLDEIVINATKISDLVQEIAAASNEQAQGITQIITALSQVDHVTQTNTASAEESASAAKELSAQAEALLNLLSKFNLSSGEAIKEIKNEISKEIIKDKTETSSYKFSPPKTNYEQHEHENVIPLKPILKEKKEKPISPSSPISETSTASSTYSTSNTTASTSSISSWGKNEAKSVNFEAPQKQKESKVWDNSDNADNKDKPKIALDDSEFGKY